MTEILKNSRLDTGHLFYFLGIQKLWSHCSFAVTVVTIAVAVFHLAGPF